MAGPGRLTPPPARPLVSCIVPAFNAAAHLAQALASITAQTHRPLDVVVVDDGSTDDTAALAEGWGAPVRLVRQDTAGPAATRNRGIEAAEGDLLAFLDPDDLWHPEKLERQVAHLAAHPDAEGCVSHVRLFWDEGFEREAQHYADSPRMVEGGVPGYATTALLARRTAFARVGLLDAERWYSDATEWFVRARDRGVRIDLLDDVLTLHRMHGENLTRRRPQASADEFLGLVHEHLQRRRGRAPS